VGKARPPGYAMSLDEGRRATLRERIRSMLPIEQGRFDQVDGESVGGTGRRRSS
jgi:hypothetical protein